MQKKEQVSDLFQAFHLANTPRFGRMLAYWCLGILMLLLLAMFLPWTQNIQSKGIVTTFRPEDRPQVVHSTIAGRIEKWYVREGQYVKKGDTLVALSEVKDKYFDPDFLIRIREQINSKENALVSTRKKADALQKQIKVLQEGLLFSLSKAKNKITQTVLKIKTDSADFLASRAEYDIAKTQLERQEVLYKKGLKSLTEYETRRLKFQETSAKLISLENKLYTSKNELLNATIELNSLEAEYLDKIAKAESEFSSTLAYFYNIEGEISKMNNEYANMQIRSSFYSILAPQDGYIVKALRNGIGETIKEGEAITSIMPTQMHLAIELFVKPMDLPLLKINDKVRLQFDGWPALVFSGWPVASVGTFGGVIVAVDNVDTNGKYRVLIVPDSMDSRWPKPLGLGSGVYGWILLKDVPVWYEIWRQLNGFPPDYTTQINEDQSGKEKKNTKVDEN